MMWQNIEIEQILVDYTNQIISINGGETTLKVIKGNPKKIMLMAYLAAHATKYPPVSQDLKGFIWSWLTKNIKGHLKDFEVFSDKSFKMLWYQGCLNPDTWNIRIGIPESGEIPPNYTIEFLKKIFVSDVLKPEERLLLGAGKNTLRMHLPDMAVIDIVPDNDDLTECIDLLKEDLLQIHSTEESPYSIGKTEWGKFDYGRLINVPPRPDIFLGRDNDVRLLKMKIGVIKTARENNDSEKITVIRGWPGIGKSTLGAAFANDIDVINHFEDGILWTSLGEAPNLLSEQQNWIRLLTGKQYLYVQDVSQASNILRKLLSSKKAFLIIDDVWDVAHAMAFKVGGQLCQLIYITRLPSVAQSLVYNPDRIYHLQQLDEEASLLLLSKHAKKVIDLHPKLCRELVNELQGLPLAIRVAGRLLTSEMKYNWGVEQLLSELKEDAEIIINSEAPSDMIDMSKETTPKVAALLKKSTDKLEKHFRKYFTMLGAFAPKPAIFDLDAMAYVWQVEDPKPIVRELVLRGLLEPVKDKKYQIHTLLATHAKSLMEMNDNG